MPAYFPPLTAREAALLAGVQPDTIRKWRQRGFIAPVAGTDRHPLYEALDVLSVCGTRGCTKPLCAAAIADGDPRSNVLDALTADAA